MLLATVAAAAAAAAHTAAWPTRGGPWAGTGAGVLAGPPSGSPLTAAWLNTTSPPDPAVWGALADDAGGALSVASSAGGDLSLVLLDAATGRARWSVPLPADGTYLCGAMAWLLDGCGAAYVTLGCGPEPLSLTNKLYKVDLATGSLVWPSPATTFGTGGFQALQRSADCAHVFTTLGSRDGPGSLVALDAASGTQVGSPFGSFNNDVGPTSALSLSADGATLVLTVSPFAPKSPVAAAFHVGGLTRGGGGAGGSSSGGSGGGAPPSQLWESDGPASGGSWVAPQQLAAAQLSDGSALLAYHAPLPQLAAAAAAAATTAAASDHVVLRRVRGADGGALWEALLPCASGGSATITGLAVSEAAGVAVLAVEHAPAGAGELLVVDLTTGAGGGAGGSCLLHPAAAGLTVRLRGLAIDATTTPPTVWATALDQVAAAYVVSNVTAARVVAAAVTAGRGRGGGGGGGASCTVARSVPLTQGGAGGGGVARAPFLAPLRAPTTSGLTADAWPSLLVGPLASQVAVVLPGVGVVGVQ